VTEATKFFAETKFRWTENEQNRKEKYGVTSSIEMEGGASKLESLIGNEGQNKEDMN
jgi:hypothetical protein